MNAFIKSPKFTNNVLPVVVIVVCVIRCFGG